MRQELEEQLVKQFPLCFGDYGKDMRETCMAWGCECGDGWFNIIKEACEKAEPIISKWIETNRNDPEYENYQDWAPRFSQVKEKYGTLRLYFTTYPDGIAEIETEAENKSAVTCEKCGKPGKLRGSGWYYTACVSCSQPEDIDNLEYLEDESIKKENGNG